MCDLMQPQLRSGFLSAVHAHDDPVRFPLRDACDADRRAAAVDLQQARHHDDLADAGLLCGSLNIQQLLVPCVPRQDVQHFRVGSQRDADLRRADERLKRRRGLSRLNQRSVFLAAFAACSCAISSDVFV